MAWFSIRKDEYSFPEQAKVANSIVRAGGRVGVGSHGQLEGLGYHWNLWMLQSGGMSSRRDHMTKTAKKMNPAKAKRLESRGWKMGNAADFLGLTEAEAALVEMKLSLSDAVRKARKQRRITQVALAKHLNSSQSRVAKLEAGDPGVSLDLLVRASLATGTTRAEVAAALSRESP